MFGSTCIFNTYHGAAILCFTITDLGIFWYCSWDFWSCVCESPEHKLQWQCSIVTITWNNPHVFVQLLRKCVNCQ